MNSIVVENSFTRRILKSLMYISGISIAGWTFAVSARFVLPMLPLSAVQQVLFTNYLSYLTSVTSASSGPVLYLCRCGRFKCVAIMILRWNENFVFQLVFKRLFLIFCTRTMGLYWPFDTEFDSIVGCQFTIYLQWWLSQRVPLTALWSGRR